jgi:hypothetical protein
VQLSGEGSGPTSFHWSFRHALLGPTGPHSLDAVDGCPLSCNLLPCQERPTTPRPSHRCQAAASEWSPTTTKPGRCTAPSRSSGAAPGGRRTAAATGSSLRRSPTSSRLVSVAAGSELIVVWEHEDTEIAADLIARVVCERSTNSRT